MDVKQKVKVLRTRAETENKRGYSGESSELTELADLIESQSTEIDHLSKALADWKYEAGCEHDINVACMRENEELKAKLSDEKIISQSLRNAANGFKARVMETENEVKRLREENEQLAKKRGCEIAIKVLKCLVRNYANDAKEAKAALSEVRRARDNAEKYHMDAADEIERLRQQLAELQRRERAAVEDLSNEMVCGACVHLRSDIDDEPCASCHTWRSCFKWRGPVDGGKFTAAMEAWLNDLD